MQYEIFLKMFFYVQMLLIMSEYYNLGLQQLNLYKSCEAKSMEKKSVWDTE